MKRTHFYSLSAAALASALLAGSAASAQAAQTTQPAGMVNPPLTVSSNGNVSVDPGFQESMTFAGNIKTGIIDDCCGKDSCPQNTNCPCPPSNIVSVDSDQQEWLKTGIFDDCCGKDSCPQNTNCPCPPRNIVSVDSDQQESLKTDLEFPTNTNCGCP